SRIRKLSSETPATLILFDLLVDERGKSLVSQSLGDRRTRLEAFAKQFSLKRGSSGLTLSPRVLDVKIARRWLAGVGATIDGVVAKRTDLPYQTGTSEGMVKVKKMRSADCVVGGFRYASKGKSEIGSLLLGLYNDEGKLDHVGFCSAFDAAERVRLKKKLE